MRVQRFHFNQSRHLHWTCCACVEWSCTRAQHRALPNLEMSSILGAYARVKSRFLMEKQGEIAEVSTSTTTTFSNKVYNITAQCSHMWRGNRWQLYFSFVPFGSLTSATRANKSHNPFHKVLSKLWLNFQTCAHCFFHIKHPRRSPRWLWLI